MVNTAKAPATVTWCGGAGPEVCFWERRGDGERAGQHDVGIQCKMLLCSTPLHEVGSILKALFLLAGTVEQQRKRKHPEVRRCILVLRTVECS